MHIFPDLARLEKTYAQELTVVGIHSAKFPGEKHAEAIRNAARRYGLRHPILNDAESKVWRRYGVRAWPTIVLLDTRGRMLGKVEGEGHSKALEKAVKQLIAEGEKNGTLKRGKLEFVKPVEVPQGTLAFPGKVLADPAGKRLFIADTLHRRILVTDVDGKVLQVIGSGKTGSTDGSARTASFVWPQGMALHKKRLLVTDTEAHRIRAIDLQTWNVSTLAGTGAQTFVSGWPKPSPARETALNSPWDLTVVGDTAYIAMAGDHRLWSLDLAKNTIAPFAGSGRENIDDGAYDKASFSQPSGIYADGDSLWIADSEDSAIRRVDLVRKRVETVVGLGLFEFGDVDGKGRRVRLQHPLHVIPWKGKLLVADTYNHKIKLINPKDRSSVTLAGTGARGAKDGGLLEATFNEPSGLTLLGDKLFVADTNNHALRVIDLANDTVTTVKVRLPAK